jgi:hypothetical protein
VRWAQLLRPTYGPTMPRIDAAPPNCSRASRTMTRRHSDAHYWVRPVPGPRVADLLADAIECAEDETGV